MIKAEELTKRRGGRAVVSGVTFCCEPGTVTGFLGPNGAGKTTTMRMLVGLSAPDSGEAREACRRSAWTHCWSSSALTRRWPGGESASTRSGRRVGQYSLGMRQRLGLAHALLGDPEVLILDEPANGLHPEGMRWMRGLLRGFADRGGTVLLSSHLLAEVEAVADRMLIIGGGRIQAQGTRAELLTESGTIVEADDLATLDAALHGAGLAVHPADGDRRLVEAEPEVIARLAIANDIVLRRLAPAEETGLERLFFELTTAGGSAPSPKTDPSTSNWQEPPHERHHPRRTDPRGHGRRPRAPRPRPPRRRRAAQDGQHPRRLLAADRHGRAHRRRGDPPAASSATVATTPSPASSTSGCSRRPCCCRSPASCSSPRSGPSALA
jgi:ABC-2 type transport system ATP-binding protein